MKSDDYFRDLEAQLRGAKPPRRVAAPVLAVTAAALIAAVFVFAGGADREQTAEPSETTFLVILENGTGSPETGHLAEQRLLEAGYDVDLREVGHAAVSSVYSGLAEADRIAEVLGLPKSATGWTGYAPLDTPIPAVRVRLGDTTVQILNGSADPKVDEGVAAMLTGIGYRIVDERSVPLRRRSQITYFGRNDDDAAREIAELLDIPTVTDRSGTGNPVADVSIVLGAHFAP